MSIEKVERPRGRIIVHAKGDISVLRYVFGISSFSEAVIAGFSMDDAKQKALEFFNIDSDKTFRVSCQRLDKQYPLTSMQFENELGEFLRQKTSASVSMKEFDVNVMAEIINGFVYFFKEKAKGLGGLPVGVGGKVIGLIEDEKSLLACLLILKRGCQIIPAALNDFDITLLKKFSYGYEIQLLHANNIEDLDELASQNNAKAIIVNDLIDDMRELNLKTRVFRPLIGIEEKEITENLNAFKNL